MNLKPAEEKKIIYADPEGYEKWHAEMRKREYESKWYNQPDAFLFDDEQSYLEWKNSGVDYLEWKNKSGDLSDFLEDDYTFPDDNTCNTPESGFTDTNLTAKQFFELDYKYSLYLLYKYIQKIDLSIQSLQEVAADGNK